MITIDSLQQRAIPVALLLARDAVVSTDRLIDVVWGDEPPASAARLRAALGEPAGPAFLLGEVLDAANERIRDRLGADGFAQQKARGASLPVDEALALVAGRLGGSG